MPSPPQPLLRLVPPSEHSWLLSFRVSNSDTDFNGNGDILTCRKHFLSPHLPLLETPQLPPIMAPSPKQPPISDFQGGSGLPSQGKQLSPHGHSNPNTVLPCQVMPPASISNWRFSSQILPLQPTCPQAHSLYSTRRLNSDFTTNCQPHWSQPPLTLPLACPPHRPHKPDPPLPCFNLPCGFPLPTAEVLKLTRWG